MSSIKIKKLFSKSKLQLLQISTFRPMSLAVSSSPSSERDVPFNNKLYWADVLRMEEEALQNSRPWQQLEMIPADNLRQLHLSKKGEFFHTNYPFERKKFDERRALMNSNVHLLHYPFEPSTQPEGLDPTQWKEAFQKTRLFLLGTKHDTMASCQDVRLLMTAVSADFLVLGMGRRQSEIMIAAGAQELKNSIIPVEAENFLAQKLQKEGIKLDDKILTSWQGKQTVENIHLNRTEVQMSMFQYNEFRLASKLLSKTMPKCAGIVLGFEAEERTERLADLADELLVERLLLSLDENRVPRFGEVLQDEAMEFVQKLLAEARRRNTIAYKFHLVWIIKPPLEVHPLKRLHYEFEDFIVENFPGFCEANTARRSRQFVRTLHTLMHRGTVEKLAEAHSTGKANNFEPLTVVAFVGHRHIPNILEIWDKPEHVYSSSSI